MANAFGIDDPRISKSYGPNKVAALERIVARAVADAGPRQKSRGFMGNATGGARIMNENRWAAARLRNMQGGREAARRGTAHEPDGLRYSNGQPTNDLSWEKREWRTLSNSTTRALCRSGDPRQARMDHMSGLAMKRQRLVRANAAKNKPKPKAPRIGGPLP